MSTPVRLNKLLAQLGVGSRRQCEQLAFQGRITVNNIKIEQNTLVDASKDVVKIDNVFIPLHTIPSPHMYIYHKPVGELVSYKAHLNPVQPDVTYSTIYDTINTKYRDMVGNKRLIYCGRLDMATTGLLVLTTAPHIADIMTGSRYGVIKRVYTVVARQVVLPSDAESNFADTAVKPTGQIPQYMIDRIGQHGITIDGVQYKPIQLRLETVERRDLHYTVELIEGKNREIRRLFEYFNLRITSLTRTHYGDYTLPAKLQPGQLAEVAISAGLQQMIDKHDRMKMKDVDARTLLKRDTGAQPLHRTIVRPPARPRWQHIRSVG